jgi:soluble lytic murein transglycosylase-like protein
MGIFLSLGINLVLIFQCQNSYASMREIAKEQYKQMAMAAAIDLALDPALLFAVIMNESDWQPRVQSNKGALGLMQLMPETARNWGVKHPLDPKENIYAGARYLKHLLALFRSLPIAIAAYHAGESRTLKAGGQIPDIPETRMYVRAVIDSYWKLKRGQKSY